MHPFAQKKSGKPGGRKLILLALAAASFSIWYFDLFPELTPVPTGSVETEQTGDINEDDFLAMLNSSPDGDAFPALTGESAEDDFTAGMDAASGKSNLSDALEQDSLMAALAEQTDPVDPLEAEFPEFAAAPADTAVTSPGSPIQQASFEVIEKTPPAQPEPRVLSPEVAELLREADRLIEANQILEAHAKLSRLYWKQPALRSEIQSRIEMTAANIYANPGTHYADPYLVQPGDTLGSIAQQYKVPWQYLSLLNRVTPEQLQAGQKLKVLTGPFSAVVDLDEFELTVHAHGWFVRRYPIGIGANGKTPPGEYTIQNKLENPTWYSPDGGQVAADDPSNPLGEYWLGLGEHLGIHGTIDPDSIGQAVSRGCLHLADDDIVEVYQLLGVGSKVTIRH